VGVTTYNPLPAKNENQQPPEASCYTEASHYTRHTFFWTLQRYIRCSHDRAPLTRGINFLSMSHITTLLRAYPAILADVMCAYPQTAIGRKLRARLTLDELLTL